MSHPGKHRGLTYLCVLFAIALAGLSLVAAAHLWEATARRERTVQAEWAGSQIASAIKSYYDSTPGGAKVFPESLDSLLADGRGPVLRRHLRAKYPNPLHPRGEWHLIIGVDNRIRGVTTAATRGQEPKFVPFSTRTQADGE